MQHADAAVDAAGRAEGADGLNRLPRHIGPAVLVGQLAWAIPGTAGTTLLQALTAEIDPEHKVETYTLLAVVGAVTSVIGTIVGGALSDRTRSRFGRRSPWLLGSAVLAGVALAGSGMTASPILVAAGYGLFQAGIGVWVASAAALIPDHVQTGAVGRASAFAGFGYLAGQTIGGVVGGLFVAATSKGLTIIPWTMVVGALIITLLLPAADNRAEPARARQVHFLKGLIPPAGRDFWLAYSGRFLFILAIVLLTTFQLFTLTDYLGLTPADAGVIISLATVLFGILATVAVIVAGPLSDKVGRTKPFVILASALVAVALIPVLIAPSVVTYVVFFALTGLAFGTYISVDQSLMVAVLPRSESAAKDLGFLSSAQTLPGVIAPILGGALAASFGYVALFVASLIVTVLAAAAIVAIRSVR